MLLSRAAVLPQIERYEIREEIGHGGMATVYRARDSRLDRWVAVKVMHPHLRGAEQARARFAREARAVARLKHRAILEIYDYSGSESENAYIATELLSGPTLRAFVERVGEVPPEIAACIAVELAGALSAAHAEGIVHRDVKPENVLLHEGQGIKLTDFGIADMLDPTVSTMTATGQILGSPFHMAPEQIEGGDTDARTDLFSLGTVLYWLATGVLPFTGKNPHQVLKRVGECNPVPALRLRPAIGAALSELIMSCLAKEPTARPASAEILAKALGEQLAKLGIEEPQATLRAYLADPVVEGARLAGQVRERLLANAREAVARRDRREAIAWLDQCLARDEGNAAALAILADLDRNARRRVVMRGVLGVSATALVALAITLFVPETTVGVRKPLAAAMAARGEQVKTPTQSPLKPPPDAVVVSAPTLPKLSTQAPVEPAPAPVGPAPKNPRPKPVRSSEPRTVVFDPEPANVTISVDGAAPRAFGPAFRMIELTPGAHTFAFVGAHHCCEDKSVTVDVPSGPGTTNVAVKLSFRAARLYVASDEPADVAIDDGLALGRSRTLISVPIARTLTERHRISVTAPGRSPYTGTVELRAGAVTQLKVDLNPSDSQP